MKIQKKEKVENYIKQVDCFIGAEILRLRRMHKMSRVQLAQMIGVTNQQLYKYENGSNRIPIGRLMLLANALGKNLEHFCLTLQLEFVEENEQTTLTMQETLQNFLQLNNSEYQNVVSALVKFLAKPRLQHLQKIS